LGTFLNGRFEEFFASRTLTKEDIRFPETSQHIAMRLKELHAGIDLLPSEREQGPIVWKNWEKWTQRCRDVIASLPTTVKSPCGTPFEIFETYVGKYRDFLERRYSGEEGLRNELVFGHNDAQYGNILRLENPSLSSEEAQPHRRLIVIDFEYASANTPGYEFANHFCEWTADYHCSTPHVMDQLRYPSRQEQRNFVAAYVDHWTKDGDDEAGKGKEVERLLEEAKVWRAASSAQWCAWGIVQAKDGVAGEEQEEFDYFAYARQRGLLFWGDLVELGLVEVEELERLAEGLGGQVKRISEAGG
jgi:choline kinase